MAKDIRRFYNLTSPEVVAAFPMYHIVKPGENKGESIIEMAHTDNPVIGGIFGLPWGDMLEAVEIVEKRHHKGTFQPGVSPLFFAVKCRKVDPSNTSSYGLKNEIEILN
jgi:hypothetical protein